MTANKIKFDALQVALLSEETRGNKSLPKEAVEAICNEIVPHLPWYVYIFESDDIIRWRVNVGTMTFEKVKSLDVSTQHGYRAFGMTNGDILVLYYNATYIKINRTTGMRTRLKKVHLGDMPPSFLHVDRLTRVSHDSDVFVSFSDIFMQQYYEIDLSTCRVIRFGTRPQPDPMLASRFTLIGYEFYKVGRGRSLLKKEGTIEPPVPTRLVLLDVRTKNYTEIPSPFEAGDTNYRGDSYAEMHDGSIMMYGGWLSDDPDETTLITRKLDVGTMTWSDIATIPKNGHDVFSSLLPNDHVLIVFEDGDSNLTAYAYDPHGDKWAKIDVNFVIGGRLRDIVVGN
jgi:hypothetical protein